MFVTVLIYGARGEGFGDSIKEAIDDAISNAALSLRKQADACWESNKKKQADYLHDNARQLENYVKGTDDS